MVSTGCWDQNRSRGNFSLPLQIHTLTTPTNSKNLTREMPTCPKWKRGLECSKWRPYKVRPLVCNSIYAKEDRNSPPSANQVVSTAEPRCGHAICTLRVTHPPPPVIPFLLKQNLSPKDIAGSEVRKLKVSLYICAMGPKELNRVSCLATNSGDIVTW